MSQLLKIQTPNNNISERSYIIDVLIKDFLGMDYTLEPADVNSYRLLFNKNRIEINDAFFNLFPEDLSYLQAKNIPDKVIFAKNDFIPETDIPVIFGSKNIITEKKYIYTGIDIFASSFFMLTRWEEHLLNKKDAHGRTPDEYQFSVRNNMAQRPLVNEYVEMLRNMFGYLGITITNKRKYTPIISHDIDFFARHDTLRKVTRTLFGDLLKRRSFSEFYTTFSDYTAYKAGRKNDPFDTFDYLMNLSESIRQQSRFYFIPSELGEEDAQYSIKHEALVKTMRKIKARGHIVGIHGAYRSYQNKKLYREELERFPEDLAPEEGRQHFLRFSNPETWQTQNDAGLKFDSTIGFINEVGFRAGTCFEYPVFNILTRKKLHLKECPLIFMEMAAFKKYPDKEHFFTKFAKLRDTVKKYKGNFVILWHNSNFNIPEWRTYKKTYEKIITEIN